VSTYRLGVLVFECTSWNSPPIFRQGLGRGAKDASLSAKSPLLGKPLSWSHWWSLEVLYFQFFGPLRAMWDKPYALPHCSSMEFIFEWHSYRYLALLGQQGIYSPSSCGGGSVKWHCPNWFIDIDLQYLSYLPRYFVGHCWTIFSQELS
jgi:hypothetical protein